MKKATAHLGLYDGAAEMEVGHLLAELHTGRFTGTSFDAYEALFDRGDLAAFPILMEGQVADSGSAS